MIVYVLGFQIIYFKCKGFVNSCYIVLFIGLLNGDSIYIFIIDRLLNNILNLLIVEFVEVYGIYFQEKVI